MTLTLHPYRLCLVKSAWYLVARPVDAEQPITLRPTRFKSVRMIDEAAELPEKFDLSSYFGNAWAVYRGDAEYAIELRFSKRVADTVIETRWHHTQEAIHNSDGSVTLRFKIDGLNEIVRWLLGWAGDVQVIAPAELRALVVERHRNAITENQL